MGNPQVVLFRSPAGLAVGLALKELRLPRIHREISPGDWFPRSAGFSGPRIRRGGNVQVGLTERRPADQPAPVLDTAANVRPHATRGTSPQTVPLTAPRKPSLFAAAAFATAALTGCGGTT